MIALLLMTQVTTSTQATAAIAGAELAAVYAARLESVSTEEAEAGFLALPERERGRFLDAWPRLTKPEGRALELYAHLRSIRSVGLEPKPTKRPEIREKETIEAKRPPTNELLELERKKKSEALAVLASTILGFGTGNFYAESYASAGAALVGQAAGLSIAIWGFSDDRTGAGVLGALVFGVARVFDLLAALVNTRHYNEALVERTIEKRASGFRADERHAVGAPPAFVWGFAF